MLIAKHIHARKLQRLFTKRSTWYFNCGINVKRKNRATSIILALLATLEKYLAALLKEKLNVINIHIY